LIKDYASYHETTMIDTYLIKKFFKKNLFDKFNVEFLPNDACSKNGKEKISDPEKNLFIWCVLFNEIELAKLFWSTIQDVIEFFIFISSQLLIIEILFHVASNQFCLISIAYFESFCWKIR
jgi:hypothetical protein